MLSNMASSLIMHKRIKTTTAKAKALKTLIEPLITKAKNDTTHSRRVVFSYLQDKEATTELFREVAEKVGDRPGGYTRIIKLGARLGDSAEMCIIELVDYNETMLADKAAASKSSRRRRGGKKKSDADVSSDQSSEALAKDEAAEDAVAPVEDAVVVETPEESIAEEPAAVETKADTEEPKAKEEDVPSEEDGEEKKAE